MTQDTPLALVTGGSRGLGKSIALDLAHRGVDVVITYRSAKSEADAVVASIRAEGRHATALPLDVGDTTTFPAFRAAIESWTTSTFGAPRSIRHLVHNGASGATGPFVETTEAAFDRQVAEHFRGPYFLTQTLLPILEDGGRIVHVTTGLTRYTLPGVSVYAAVKGALEVLTRSLAVELAGRRITVNAVAPGGLDTDFNGGTMRDPELQRWVAKETPLGRMGRPDDVSGVVAFLLSDESRWLTGQRLELAGGYRL